MDAACGRPRTCARYFGSISKTVLPRGLVFCDEEFHSCLSDFPRLSSSEAANCEREITEGEVHLALKGVSSIKSPELDGLPYAFYFSLSHMFAY